MRSQGSARRGLSIRLATAVTASFLPFLPGPCVGADADAVDPVLARASEVRAAVSRGEEDALQRGAAAADPDPWLVADALLSTGDDAAAEKFAELVVASVPDTLPAYVRRRRGGRRQEHERTIVEDARRRIAERKPEAALRLLEVLDIDKATVPWVVSRSLMAAAHAALDDWRAQGDALAAAATAAAEMGWWWRAQLAWHGAAHVAFAHFDYAAARIRWESRLRAVDALGDLVLPSVAPALLNNIASAAGESGDLAAASEYLRRAVAGHHELGDAVSEAQALANWANVLTRRGEYVAALARIEEARRTLAQAPGDVPGARVRAARGALDQAAGNVENELGHHSAARPFHERALAHAKEIEADEPMAIAYANLGIAVDGLGDHVEAARLTEESLAHFEKRRDSVRIAQALVNISEILEKSGDSARALTYMTAAVQRLSQVGDALAVAAARAELAQAKRLAGDAVAALALHRAALTTAQELGARALTARIWSGIAEDLLESDPAGALTAAKTSLRLTAETFAGLSDQQGIAARTTFEELCDVGVAAAIRANDANEIARFLEGGRAGALLEALGGATALRDVAVPERFRVEERQAIGLETQAFARWTGAVASGDRAAVKRARADLDAARARVLDVVGTIQRDAKASADLVYPKPDDLAALQRTLVDGEVLVLYALGREGAIAQVVERASTRTVSLGKSSEIVGECLRFTPADGGPDVTTQAKALRARVVEPLKLRKDARRVLLSPSGALAHVPFAMLIPETTVAYVQSGTVLGILRAGAQSTRTRALGVGDPDYKAFERKPELASHAGFARGLPSLPGTRAEVEGFADVALFGREATEARLRAEIAKEPNGFRAIHIGGHGLVDVRQTLASSIALTPDGDDDGLFTVLEVLRTRIPADLVVLSACRSGIGRHSRGEGIEGFTRAFFFAGASRVIASLWDVNDESTSALMKRFYELWRPRSGAKPVGAADALRQAQEFVGSQEKWKDARYWAAWQLWGLPE